MINAVVRLSFAAALLTASVIACGGGEDPAPPSSSKQESSATQSSNDKVCVEKDSKPNEKGVGRYCDKDENSACGYGLVCTALFGAPEGSWFCTTPCSDDSDCGSGAHCFSEERGKGCVLDRCQAK
jgi:hypothetical protein